MSSQLTPYITLMCTSGVLNMYLCFYVFLKRHNYTNIASFFVMYTAAIAIYCFAAALGLLATTLEEMKFWTIIQYIGLPASSPLGLLFIMHYLGIKITKTKIAALLAIPFVSLVMVATNDWHHLHYRVFEIDPVLGVPFIHQEIGMWYTLHGVFTFGCMFVAFLLLISRWKETAETYRLQLIALLFGQLVPMLTAFLYLIGATPPGIDPVPMVLWLSSLLYLWAISSSRLFTLMPIAKDAIFNSINDGVLVLDESQRLVEFNQAAKRTFPALDRSMYGKSFSNVWPALSGNASLPELKGEDVQELKLTAGDSGRIFQVRTAPLHQAKNSKGMLVIFSDITELKSLQAQLEHQAFYDELTQVYNRRAFMQQCEKGFTEAKKASEPFSVVLMDIDFFKRVNDNYGHHIGDQVLVHAAKICKAHLKGGQIFARYGGEEFVLALKGSAAEAKAIADDLRKSLQLQPLTIAEDEISVTLSLGVAEAMADEETLYQLLNKADQALYSAKQKGRNRVEVYTATTQKETVH